MSFLAWHVDYVRAARPQREGYRWLAGRMDENIPGPVCKEISSGWGPQKAMGLNHIAFYAPTRRTVDVLQESPQMPRKVRVLYGGIKE